jgi:hypothetical protein
MLRGFPHPQTRTTLKGQKHYANNEELKKLEDLSTATTSMMSTTALHVKVRYVNNERNQSSKQRFNVRRGSSQSRYNLQSMDTRRYEVQLTGNKATAKKDGELVAEASITDFTMPKERNIDKRFRARLSDTIRTSLH